MIAVLIGIPVNFIFSGWEEDELACTFAHFSSTWFMWVEYKTLSFFFSPPPPFTPHHIPLYQEHIHACTHTHTDVHTHGVVNYCLWVVSCLGQFMQVYASFLYGCLWQCMEFCVFVCTCMFFCLCVCVCTSVSLWIHTPEIAAEPSMGMIPGRRGSVITQTCLHSKYVMKSCW